MNKAYQFFSLMLVSCFLMMTNIAAAQPAAGTTAPAPTATATTPPPAPTATGTATTPAPLPGSCSTLMKTIDDCKVGFCKRVQECVGTGNRRSTQYASNAVCHESTVTRLTAAGQTETVKTGAVRNNRGSCSCGEGFKAVEVADMRTFRTTKSGENTVHTVNRHYWCFPDGTHDDASILAGIFKNIREEMKKLQEQLAEHGIRLQSLEDTQVKLVANDGEHGRQINLLWTEVNKLGDRTTKLEERVAIVEGINDELWNAVGGLHELHIGVRGEYSAYPAGRRLIGVGPEISWVTPNLWRGGPLRLELGTSVLVGDGTKTRLYATDGRTFEWNMFGGAVFDLTNYSRRAAGEVPHHQLHLRMVYSQLIREDNDVNRVTTAGGETGEARTGSNHWPSWGVGGEVKVSIDLGGHARIEPFLGLRHGESGFRNPPGAPPREENPVKGWNGVGGLVFSGVW